jgi:hypothetical protein
MGLRTQLTEGLVEFDVDASWWVTSEAYEKGYYEKLYNTLRQWLKEFPFNNVYYSNQEIPNED